MNFKSVVGKIIKQLWPELDSGTHLPLLGVVSEVPDPPANGEVHADERPRYAVDVRLLRPDGKTIDKEMPLLRDIPVALPAAAPDRGFAALPQPGTIVEIAFAFGRQSLPFVRSVLPWNLKLPAIDAESQRWQQSSVSYQEVDKSGNWIRKTTQTISDIAGKIWIGSESENTLIISGEFMTAVIAALATLANHTHNGGAAPDQSGSIDSNSQEVTWQKQRLDAITKT